MRPNILCLVSEDCPTRLGAYGDTLARTPNLDRLAARGVTFKAANCTSPVCAPSRFSILTGRYPESAPPAQQMTAYGPMPSDTVTYPEMMRAAGYYCTNNSKTHYNVDIDAVGLWDDCSGTAHWANRPKDTPFLAVFNAMLTHESCVFENHAGAVTSADVVLPNHLPDLPELRENLATYYNRIEAMDAWMGDRLAELDAAGIAEDTIIFYFSDHGAPLPRSKRFCYDDGLRIPLIVYIPEKWRHLLPEPPGSQIGIPVSLLDLLQSFAVAAGINAPDGVQGVPILGPQRLTRTYAFSGRDRMDSRYDLTRSVRGERFRYIRNYAPHRPWGQFYSFAWLATGYQAYERMHLAGELSEREERFWRSKPAEELYDMWHDPDSLVNLAADPEHFGTLASMGKALDAHMLAIHDGGFIPEGSAAEVEEQRNDATAYPIARVIALANAAIQRDPEQISDFLEALSDASAVVRYWGAQGLLILAVAGTPMPSSLDRLLQSETDPDVLVALLEASGHTGHAEQAVRRLTDFCDADKPLPIRLKAMSALTALPSFPDISGDVINRAAGEPGQYIRGAAGYLDLQMSGKYEPGSKIFDMELFRTHMVGHHGIGPQSFPDLDTLRRAKTA